MRKWMLPGAVVLAVAAFGLGWSIARPAAAVPKFTAQDYFEIQMLYGRYTHSIDHGALDGMDYAETFVPDGVLVTVTAASPCTRGELWDAADRDVIRGSIADEKNISNVCISKMIGTQKLAALAKTFKTRQERHVHTNFLVTPTADGGATAMVYLNQLNVLNKPPTWSASGIYNDTLVRTANGWRFKKRIITQNAVFPGASN
jgi:hypothetical protein